MMIKVITILSLAFSLSLPANADALLTVKTKLLCNGDYQNGPHILKRDATLELELLELDGELKYYTVSNHYFGPIDANVASPLNVTYDMYLNNEYENNSLIELLNLDRNSLEISWTRYRKEWTPSNIDFYGVCSVLKKPKI